MLSSLKNKCGPQSKQKSKVQSVMNMSKLTPLREHERQLKQLAANTLFSCVGLRTLQKRPQAVGDARRTPSSFVAAGNPYFAQNKQGAQIRNATNILGWSLHCQSRPLVFEHNRKLYRSSVFEHHRKLLGTPEQLPDTFRPA